MFIMLNNNNSNNKTNATGDRYPFMPPANVYIVAVAQG